MAAPLSQDLRKRLVEAVEEGSSARAAAARFQVSPSAAVNIVRAHARPAARRPHGSAAIVGRCWRVMSAAARSDDRQEGITPGRDQGQLVSAGSSGLAVDDLVDAQAAGLSHKKALRAAEQDRPDVAAHRRRWRVWQRYMDPAAFVFLDETGAAPIWRGARLEPARRAPGRCRAARALEDHTFLAGLRSTGIIAPLVLDGPMTGEAFLAYVCQFLAPRCRPATSW